MQESWKESDLRSHQWPIKVKAKAPFCLFNNIGTSNYFHCLCISVYFYVLTINIYYFTKVILGLQYYFTLLESAVLNFIMPHMPHSAYPSCAHSALSSTTCFILYQLCELLFLPALPVELPPIPSSAHVACSIFHLQWPLHLI